MMAAPFRLMVLVLVILRTQFVLSTYLDIFLHPVIQVCRFRDRSWLFMVKQDQYSCDHIIHSQDFTRRRSLPHTCRSGSTSEEYDNWGVAEIKSVPYPYG